MASHVRVSHRTKDLPKHRRRWEVSYVDPLTGRKRTRGGFTSETEANNWHISFENRIREQLYVDDKAGRVLFSDAAAEWLDSKRNLKRQTRAGYAKLLGIGNYAPDEEALAADKERLRIPTRFGPAPVARIDQDEIIAWLSDLEKAGKASSTIRNAFFVVKQVMAAQVSAKRIAVNPCLEVEIPKLRPWALLEDDEEGRRLAPEEVEALAQRLPDPYGLLVRLTAYTGLRAGEVAGLQVRDIDLKAGVLRVRREVIDIDGILSYDDPKSENSRRDVTLDPYIAQELKEYMREHEKRAAEWFGERPKLTHPGRELPLFVGTAAGRRGKNPVTGELDVIRFDYTKLLRHGAWYGAHYKSALKAAGLDTSYRFHDLRHTYGSWLYEAGVDIKTISRQMGHASVETTLRIYVHPDKEKANDAVRSALGNLRAGTAAQASRSKVVPLRRQVK